MKLKILLLLLISGIFVQAQNSNFDADIKHFIEINGTMGQYQDAVSQLTNMLKEQYKEANVTDAVWNETKLVAEKSLIGLSDDLVVVYKNFFSHDEIIALNKLYESEVAQKFINNVVSLSDASQDASIVWSRSLYNQITDLLYQKGYTE